MTIFTTLLYRLTGVYQPELLVSWESISLLVAVNSLYCKGCLWISPPARIADALGMGLGYTAVLTLVGMIREFVGLGQFFGRAVLNGSLTPFS